MTLRCFSTKSILTHLYNLYDDNDSGTLWRGEPSDIAGCPDTSPPDSSRCVPCFADPIYHVICKDLPEKFKMVMERVNETIDSFDADTICPTIFEPTVSEPTDRPAEETELPTAWEFPLWAWLLIALCIFIIIGVVVYKRRSLLESGRRFLQTCKSTRHQGQVPEISPMNEVSTNQV